MQYISRLALILIAAALATAAPNPTTSATPAKAPAKPAAAKTAPAKAAAKPTGAKAAPPAKISIPAGPKLLTVAAAAPFMGLPVTGPSKVSVTVCPEETEPGTFSVRCSKPMAAVRVSAYSDFVGPGRIPRANIEVCKIEGDGLISTTSPGSGVVYTEADIGPSLVHFWMRVHVPKRTPAGTYKGAIGFSYQNKIVDVVPVEVNVRNLRLVGSSKQYIVYTTYGPGACGMDTQGYGQFLAAFKRLGLKQMMLNSDPAAFGDAITAYVSAGMMGPAPVLTYSLSKTVPTLEEVKNIQLLAATAGVRSLLFLPYDQPVMADELSAAQLQLDVFRQARARTAVRVTDQQALETLKNQADGVDYHVQIPYVQSLIKCEAVRTSSKWEWFWWDARKSVSDNRLFAGLGLWKSGLDGCMPVWMPEAGEVPCAAVDSLHGEALREGVDDTRYITTYMKALRELKDLKRQGDKDYIASTEAYLTAFVRKPLDQITLTSLSDFRSKMAEFAMTLERRL